MGRKSVMVGMLTSAFVVVNAAQASVAAAGTAPLPPKWGPGGHALAGTPTYVPQWAPATAYAVGQQVASPNNDLVSANVAHTSSAAYTTDTADWTLSPTFTPKWAPATAYVVGQQVVSPNNDVVSANVAHTSSSSFTTDTADWTLSATFASKATETTVTTGRLAATALGATYVQRANIQSAEAVPLTVFTVQPATAGFEPFQVRQNSWPNYGAALGTYNHTLHLGWNASRHAGGGDSVNGKPAIYMGFEDNYFDAPGDQTYGVEWYVGYVTPDGTTIGIADLRPFYFRILASNTNTVDKSVYAHVDIGSGPLGYFAVVGSVKTGTSLFSVHPDYISAKRQVHIEPVSGVSLLVLNSPNGPTAADRVSTIMFKLGTAPQFQITADPYGEMYIFDSVNNRVHTNFMRGTTSDTSKVEVNAVLKLKNTQATTAAAGSAVALPATPQGYFQIQDSAGVLRKVPYYV